MPNTHTTLKSLFDDVADAIREKDGTSASIVADTFPAHIRAIPQGSDTPYAIISVTYPSGSTCTCTKGSTVLTAEGTSGSYTFNLPEFGTWTVACTNGSQSASQTFNATQPSTNIALMYIPSVLNNATWAEISSASSSGNASNVWAVGDRKTISISGIGSFYVYILGFNHYGATNTIDFSGFKQTSDGKDLALYSYKMNTSMTNNNGWKGSYMRYTLLGSTNVSNGDATSTCATSPVSGSLMAKFPSDLRAVMKPMTIWTNNTGGSGDIASKVTTSVDYLPLLAEVEIFGNRAYANSAEKNHQQQYQYYANGNSKVKYRHNSTSSAAYWWERSPYYNDSVTFACVATNGSRTNGDADGANGVAPIFRV